MCWLHGIPGDARPSARRCLLSLDANIHFSPPEIFASDWAKARAGLVAAGWLKRAERFHGRLASNRRSLIVRLLTHLLLVSMELSRRAWLITSLSPGVGRRCPSTRFRRARCAVAASFRRALAQGCGTDRPAVPIIVIQEAGLDGYWLHRVLQSERIESQVVDAASILISRRRQAGEDLPDRWRDPSAHPDGLQAWRAAGVRWPGCRRRRRRTVGVSAASAGRASG